MTRREEIRRRIELKRQYVSICQAEIECARVEISELERQLAETEEE